MNERQRQRFESLKKRVVAKTCISRPAEIVKAETEDMGRGNWLFHIAAEAGIFHGSAIGYLGPRGGVHMTCERYEFY